MKFRFQFSTLFAKAWMRGMTPTNIISGYKACGIYPYNPDAILKQFEGLPSLPTPQSSLQESTVIHSEFSDQQIELFETRFLEGYDIFEDEEYILWLKSYHRLVPSKLSCLKRGTWKVMISLRMKSMSSGLRAITPKPFQEI